MLLSVQYIQAVFIILFRYSHMLNWINQNLGKSVPKIQQPAIQRDQHPELLPFDLSGRILDLQFQCDSEAVSKQLIGALTCLYIEAMEYYQARNSEKFKIYHRRMELFLKKAAVDDILRGKSGALVSKREDTEKRITHARTKSKSEVNRILTQTEKRVSHSREIISKDIQQQNKRLEDRIHKRRTMSNRSMYSQEEEMENEEKHNKYLRRLGVDIQGLGSGGVGVDGASQAGIYMKERV